MNSAVDIAPLLDEGRWTSYQRILTLISALAIIFDGFDIQILGFAVPSMMREWGLTRGAFAPVLAFGLLGMAAGSPVAGFIGDRWGRRPALVLSLWLFAAATLATSLVHSVVALGVLRFLTGVGTGGALPNAGALVAEFAPLRNRPMAVKLTIVCVPLGGMLGGLLAADVLPAYGWRALYQLGGIAPLVFGALLWLVLPESPRFLVQNPRRWPELARLLKRMSRDVAPSGAFRDSGERSTRQGSISELLGPALRRDTAGLWVAFFFCLGGIYLVFGWLPTMLTGSGVNVAAASRGLATYNLGGVGGVFLWTLLVTAFGSRRPLLAGALGAAVAAAAILLVPTPLSANLTLLLGAIGLNGLLANAVQTSMYALASHLYPASIRATGIAYASAVGRMGGVVSSLGGATIIAAGPATYWGVIGISMLLTFAGLAWIRGHFLSEVE